jgi:hypothetical protein
LERGQFRLEAFSGFVLEAGAYKSFRLWPLKWNAESVPSGPARTPGKNNV